MNRFSFTIRGDFDRARLAELAPTLALGMRVEIKPERRTNAQNDRFWAMLGDIAAQLPWHGIKLTDEDWKLIFISALKREVRIVPNIDGNGFVNLSQSSSDLSVSEMSDLMELMASFGANHGVQFHEPESSSADVAPPGRPLDAPAGAAVPRPPAGATSSNSSDGNRQADLTNAPAVGSPRHASPAAGARNFEEASLLSDDWRDVVLQNLCGIRDKPASLNTREADARQMIGGKPNAVQDAWIRDAKDLVKRRNEGKISPDMFAILRQELLTCIRLPNGEELV